MNSKQAVNQIARRIGPAADGWDEVLEITRAELKEKMSQFSSHANWDLEILEAKAPNASWLVIQPVEYVLEIAVKNGLAKVIAYHPDLETARADGFSADEIALHVSTDRS